MPVSTDPGLTFVNETVFEGSEVEGARCCGAWNAKAGGREDLLGVGADHKAWLKRRRQTGDVEPKPIPGRPSRKGAMLQPWLPQHLETNHNLTLEEHREAFEEEFGQTVSTSTIGRVIAGLPDGGWPIKKSHP